MDPASAYLAAAGVGGLMNYFGQQSANDTNVSLARETNSQNLQIARENRNWQEGMSNTAHQREMQDLKMAGLNPILAGTGGAGASTPSGSTSTSVAPQVENVMSGAVTSAMEGARLFNDYKSQQLTATKNAAEIDKMQAEKGVMKQQIAESAMRTKVLAKDIPKADYTNRIYKQFEPALKKIEESTWDRAKRKQQMNQRMRKNPLYDEKTVDFMDRMP